VDDLLANRQADTRSGILRLAMEALKHAEDGLMVLCGDADAIVFYAEHPNVALPFGGHVHVGMSAILTILNGIAYEVLEELCNIHVSHRKPWQIGVSDGRMCLGDCG
jgi:hypothetical protein